MSGWTALAIVPAFGVDTFAVAAGLGSAGFADRRRLALVIAAFEGGMPLVGALIGAGIGALIAAWAVWAASALLALLGLREIVAGLREAREDDDDDERARALVERFAGAGLIAAGLSVSLDELTAGLAAGAARLPLDVLVPALALQAFIFTYAGLHAGERLRRWAGRYGDVVAGLALIAAAAVVAFVAR